ncbi:TonB-dependent receptor [Steroidobacter cummioxidans]|uniref:TonB-dependent receptor n=1 Tax=Steroidobacter cummioxidans TaxID=1803913 RepID=UPI000E315459|nr:TonB-dependent receptor [Steroidobacter cummioxidans]
MLSSSRRTPASITAAVAAALCFASAAQAQVAAFDVPSQVAASGVRAFAKQAGIQIILAGSVAEGRITNTVRGEIDTRDALDRLLSGTGLVVRSYDGKTAILDAAEPTASADADALEQIVVTGSHIARSELESAMPIGVVNMELALKQGKTTAYETVLRDVAVGPGNGPFNSAPEGQYDGGMATIELRNMGVSRSLTLVDGRRRVSGAASSSAVDINMIPSAMIDRIEIITGGAAAVYGADAVTGAANVITRKDFEGLEVTATTGTTEHGGGDRTQVSLVAGTRFADDRGTITIGGTYLKNEPIYFHQRYSKDTNIQYQINPANTGPHDGIPDRIVYYRMTNLYLQPEPNIFVGGQTYLLNPDGSARIGSYDACLSSCTSARSAGDGGSPQSQYWSDFLIAPIENASFIGRFDYEVTDWLSYGLRFDYGRSKYDAYRRPYRDDERTTWLNGAGGATAYLDNPYLPESFRQIMVANGLTSTPVRRSYEIFGQMGDVSDRQSLTVGNTFQGELPGGFHWEAFWQYGRSTNDIAAYNATRASRFIAARDVISDPVTGEPVCRDAAARAAGCVPFNIFSFDELTPEQRDYMIATRRKHRENTQTVYGGNLKGSLFSLPAGQVQAAIGVERRKEAVDNIDDNLAAPPENELSHLGNWAPYEPALKAANDVSEIYAELVVPVLRDLPFAQRLTLEGAYRYSDYSDFESTNTWKLGGNWAPIEGLTFRAVKSRSVRVPNFGELYASRAIQAIGLTDPCMGTNYNANPTRARNCAALGITAPLPNQIYTGYVISGGNPDVNPETSDSSSIGLVWQPGFLPGFDLTLDYWHINIDNIITALSRTNIPNLCVDLPSIDNEFCGRTTRDENQVLMWVDTSVINASMSDAKGIDIGANYRRPLGQGTLSLGLRGSYLMQFETTTLPGVSSSVIRYDGGYQNPQFRATLFTSYVFGDWDIGLDTRFWSSAKLYPNAQTDEEYDDNRVGAQIYNDLSVGWQMNDHVTFRSGINNLRDVDAPYHPGTYYQGGGGVYDVYGRYFFGNVKITF